MELCRGLGVDSGVMLARGKTTTTAPSEAACACPACCCYCDLYSLAEWAYRDKLPYPHAPVTYSPAPHPCPEMTPGEGVPAALHNPHVHVSPDVAAAFLLSLDLLRPHSSQYHALHHALENHAFKHASHRRSLSSGTPGVVVKPGEGEGGGVVKGCGGGGHTTDHPPPPPPIYPSSANLHMPHYQIDPSIRVTGGGGGNLSALERALRYPEQPLPHASTPSPALTPNSWLPYPIFVPESGGGSHNGDGGGGTEGGGGADEEELGPFWDILDNEIRPIKPLPSCPESQKIFSEHKEMARKYLVLQQEIFNLRKRKSTLENKLSQAEKVEQLGNQRYQDKIRELESKRESLRHTHSRLRQQLEQIRTRQEEQQKQQEQQDDGNDVGLDHHLPLAPP